MVLSARVRYSPTTFQSESPKNLGTTIEAGRPWPVKGPALAFSVIAVVFRMKKSCASSRQVVQKTNRASRYTVLFPLALRPAAIIVD